MLLPLFFFNTFIGFGQNIRRQIVYRIILSRVSTIYYGCTMYTFPPAAGILYAWCFAGIRFKFSDALKQLFNVEVNQITHTHTHRNSKRIHCAKFFNIGVLRSEKQTWQLTHWLTKVITNGEEEDIQWQKINFQSRRVEVDKLCQYHYIQSVFGHGLRFRWHFDGIQNKSSAL